MNNTDNILEDVRIALYDTNRIQNSNHSFESNSKVIQIARENVNFYIWESKNMRIRNWLIFLQSSNIEYNSNHGNNNGIKTNQFSLNRSSFDRETLFLICERFAKSTH